MTASLDPSLAARPRSAFTPRTVFTAALLAILALFPLYSLVTGNTFVLTLFTRVLILAIGAVSLNLIMGYGGMVSFGHAAYLGVGGYAVGILAKEGIGSGFVQWPVAVAASALYALVVGALSLRTRGVYFIMITLAFAQMIYYVAIGLDRYGGDDGLTIYKRSDFGGLIDLNNRTLFYYLCFAVLLASIYLVARLVNSRFGLAIRGTRSNERRMRAIGFPTFRYKLVAFVIAGALCGRSDRHGGAGRPRLAVWAGDRRCDFPAAAGRPVAGDRIFQSDPRSDPAAGCHLRARRHWRPARRPAPCLARSCKRSA
jgi:branched-chain amino acid transport system permease protein